MGKRLRYSYPKYYRHRWGSPHIGKWCKRKLNKLRRKYWKEDQLHTGNLYGWESTVNYRND